MRGQLDGTVPGQVQQGGSIGPGWQRMEVRAPWAVRFTVLGIDWKRERRGGEGTGGIKLDSQVSGLHSWVDSGDVLSGKTERRPSLGESQEFDFGGAVFKFLLRHEGRAGSCIYVRVGMEGGDGG